jgi:DNA-binding GntR family transcriptional regulator
MTTKRGASVEDAYTKIKSMINLNQLAPGQKIISNDLARKLKISPTPLIQALNRLEASGFVVYQPNKGYFISEITVEEAHQLYEAREALESYLVPKIIANIGRDDIEDIRAAFRDYGDLENMLPDRHFIMADAKFHLRLAEYAKNETILKMLREIFEKLFLRYPPHYLLTARVKEIAAEHRSILEAYARRDVVAALAVTQSHIVQGRDRIINSLRSQTWTEGPIS